MTSVELKVQFKRLHWSMPDWATSSRSAKNSQGRRWQTSFDAYEASKLVEVAAARNPNAKSVMELRDLISDIKLLVDL